MVWKYVLLKWEKKKKNLFIKQRIRMVRYWPFPVMFWKLEPSILFWMKNTIWDLVLLFIFYVLPLFTSVICFSWFSFWVVVGRFVWFCSWSKLVFQQGVNVFLSTLASRIKEMGSSWLEKAHGWTSGNHGWTSGRTTIVALGEKAHLG